VDRFEFVLATGTWTAADIENEHLQGQPATVRAASLATAEEVERETATADGVIVSTNPLPRGLIHSLGPRVRIIARAGIGLDAIDLDAAAERGIAVFHTPEYATDEVASHAVALILALNRKIVEANDIARHDWPGWNGLAPIRPLRELTVGLIGAGRIGRATAGGIRALVGRVVVYDPFVSDTPIGIERVDSLDDLLRQSDVVSLHLPLTDETRGMIGRRELHLLSPGALIVNVSRGPLIDQNALVEALVEGHIGGAGLDVLEEEPPPASAAILKAPNVILSPHLAWYSVASERRTRTMAVDGMLDYLNGRPPRAGRMALAPQTTRP
jgi:D-3-phosphoglycerate dehydrogenase / 2-oxoglutarate reductase